VGAPRYSQAVKLCEVDRYQPYCQREIDPLYSTYQSSPDSAKNGELNIFCRAGAPVEALTQGATVLSALNIPSTNQVRFTLDTGITLMYDYFFGQWGTFVNVPALSSTVYQGLHTYINSLGQVSFMNVGRGELIVILYSRQLSKYLPTLSDVLVYIVFQFTPKVHDLFYSFV
jgi:hypothetical protein